GITHIVEEARIRWRRRRDQVPEALGRDQPRLWWGDNGNRRSAPYDFDLLAAGDSIEQLGEAACRVGCSHSGHRWSISDKSDIAVTPLGPASAANVSLPASNHPGEPAERVMWGHPGRAHAVAHEDHPHGSRSAHLGGTMTRRNVQQCIQELDSADGEYVLIHAHGDPLTASWLDAESDAVAAYDTWARDRD